MEPQWSRFLAMMINSRWYKALSLDDQIRLRNSVTVTVKRGELSEWATLLLDKYVEDTP